MSAGVVFRRTSALALRTAPQLASADATTNAKLLEQEQLLYEMSDGLGRLKGLGGAIGGELGAQSGVALLSVSVLATADRQNALIDTMTVKTDATAAHIKTTNKKIDKML